MKSNIVKTCILVVLIVLSLYQTIGLWFDDLSDLNLFYDIVQYNTQVPEELSSERSYFITPELIAIYSQSEKEYSLVKKTTVDFNELLKKTVNALKVILTKGEIVEEIIPKERLWESQNVLLKYPLTINSHQLVTDLDVKNLSFVEHVDTFNEMIIIPVPEESSETYIYVYFINDNDYKDVKGLRIKKNDIKEDNKNLYDAIVKESQFSHFTSSKNIDMVLFEKNVLLPETDFFGTDTVYLKKPFYQDQDIDSNQLEDYINGFFANNYKWKIDDEQNEEQWTYSNESVLVNYNTNGIIEYINDNLDNKKDLSLIESYHLARRFIDKKDNKIKEQEYYLVDYTEDGNKITFNFAYKYNDVKVVISEDYLQSYNLNSPMEITVMDGQIRTYKRLLLLVDDYIKPEEKYITDYNQVINKFLKAHPDENNIQDMFLGYIHNPNVEDMKLNWIIITDNLIYYDEVTQLSQEE